MSTALAVQNQVVAVRHELDVVDVIAQVQKIQRVMAEVMKPGEHYGVIPGTGTKPTLLKPGAEKLCLTFRLDPQYTVTTERDGRHVTKESTCTLYHIPTGLRMGSGMGSCSTKESKYAYRKGGRVCPECGKDTIIKGKAEYGGGWLCYGKKGGCGAKWKEGDAAIESQSTDRIPNEDLEDQNNTVLKMANKRALVAAVLNVTAASDIFTQDLEDRPDISESVLATVREQAASRVAQATEAELITESENLFPKPDAIRDPLIKRIEKFNPSKIKVALHRVLSVDPEMDWRKLDVAAMDMLARHLEVPPK